MLTSVQKNSEFCLAHKFSSLRFVFTFVKYNNFLK